MARAHGGGGVAGGKAVDLLGHRPQRGQGITEVRRLPGPAGAGICVARPRPAIRPSADPSSPSASAVCWSWTKSADATVAASCGVYRAHGLDRAVTTVSAVSAAAHAISTVSRGSHMPHSTAVRASETRPLGSAAALSYRALKGVPAPQPAAGDWWVSMAGSFQTCMRPPPKPSSFRRRAADGGCRAAQYGDERAIRPPGPARPPTPPRAADRRPGHADRCLRRSGGRRVPADRRRLARPGGRGGSGDEQIPLEVFKNCSLRIDGLEARLRC